MKKIITLIMFCAVAMCAMAIPALRQWQTVTQPDGTTLDLMMVGDENLHYYITRDQVPVVQTDESTYCYAALRNQQLASSGVLAHEATKRQPGELQHAATAEQVSRARAPRTAQAKRASQRKIGQQGNFTGTKRAIVILTKYIDKQFAGGDDAAYTFYNNMLNQDGFNYAGAIGSVNNYFKDMSREQFDLQFDIYGPVGVKGSAKYYGGQSYNGGFDYAGDLISESIESADSIYDIDWTTYDWDKDGEVEQVFVLYAGYGRATSGPLGTIWPHAWTLDEAFSGGCGGRGGISKDGVYINQYACGNELYGYSGTTYMGMGVFCHEFSHCMGLPDMYDTGYAGHYGMDDWDLLDHGSYNGPDGLGEVPAGWTSYERNYAGWLDWEVLQPGQEVTGMKALTNPDGKAYVIYNDAHPDEYYLLENRRHEAWDTYTPDEGLLIIHVDYDALLWENNIVNTTGTFRMSEGYTANFTNDHPRMEPIHKLRSVSNDTYYDTYPIITNKLSLDSLTDNSKPAATLYNNGPDGTKLMHKPLTHITKADNGDISFVFMEQAEPIGIVGDVNNDGEVSVADVTVLVNIVLNNTPLTGNDLYRADVNGDGEVGVADITALINMILNLPASDSNEE
ncbi:MAG: M6 family metalloprotease domain-containing protein [Muribaculaceae bacterium]|nr:M6 family metalloprotease domain-containing protein [Muribaculaceae bacterium]